MFSENYFFSFFFTFSLQAQINLPECKINKLKVTSNFKCKGKINFNDSFTYEGEFTNTLIEGFGTLTWHKSNEYKKYKGYFINNKLHGVGKLHFINGDKYIGEFVKGNREGNGEKIF